MKPRMRKMEQKDIKSVVLLENDIFTDPWSEQSFHETIDKDYTYYLVAEDVQDGKIVGYCGYYQSGTEADIVNVAVREEHRRKGIAALMLSELIAIGTEKGIRNYILEVRESNSGAICLYRGMGFEHIGIREAYYKKPIEDAVIMKRSYDGEQ